MNSIQKRAGVVLGLAVAAVPLAIAALAYACTGLATVAMNPGTATVGDSVTVTGKGFAAHDPSDARSEPVRIRFDSPTGPVVGSASPAPAAGGGSFSAQITVPALEPGVHILVATQNGLDGRPAYGSPARTSVTVNAPPAAQPAPTDSSTATTVFGAPAIAAPFEAPVATGDDAAEAAVAKAVRRCRARFKASKASSKGAKRRMASRRTACINRATARLS